MSRWPMVPLGEISSVITKGTTPKTLGHQYSKQGIPFLRGEEIQGTAINFGKVKHFISEETNSLLNRSIIRPGDLLITIAGTIGRVGYVPDDAPPMNCNQAVAIVRPANGQLDLTFASYALQSQAALGAILRQGTTATITNLSLKQIAALQVPLPPLDEQRRIVDLLNRAAGIRRLREQALATARNTIPALFLQTFGDLRTTANRYPIYALEDVSDIGSGLTKGRKLKDQVAEETPYLRVANVQDGYLDLREIKTIPATAGDRVRHALRAGDLLLTEGGDPDKLGRGAIWDGQIEGCLHQNHVFRVRPDTAAVLPDYLSAAMGSAYGKEYFLRVAKRTTGIASVNRTQLGAFPLPLPPLDLQRRFAARLADLRGIVTQQERALAAARTLERALLARLLE